MTITERLQDRLDNDPFLNPLDVNLIREAKKEIDTLSGLLKQVEWCDHTQLQMSHFYCPICHNHMDDGHTDTCQLRKALEVNK